MSEPVDPYGGRPAPDIPPYGYPQPPGPPYPAGPYGPAPYGLVPYGRVPVGYVVRPARPAVVTTAAVLAFVLAGLLLLAGIVLFAGVSFINALDDAFGGRRTALAGELGVVAAVTMLTGGLLLAGGVQLLGGKAIGRTFTFVGCLLVLAEGVYWVARPDDVSSTIGLALVFAALALVTSGLMTTAPARLWSTPRPPSGA